MQLAAFVGPDDDVEAELFTSLVMRKRMKSGEETVERVSVTWIISPGPSVVPL